MKIREIITRLNIAISNSIEKEKYDELKDIIKDLIPYAELEEELGIDLITLFKAMKNGIWIKRTNKFGEVFYDREEVSSFSFYFKEIYVEHECEYQYPYALKDYGVTWALTKEELL